MEEIWKVIPGHDGKYQVSNFGNVRSFKQLKDGLVLKPYVNHHGYFKVCLQTRGEKRFYFIHRLVADAFLKKPESNEKLEINHIDANKQNNYYENLEWVTHTQNLHHAIDMGQNFYRLDGAPSASKTIRQYSKDGLFIAEYVSASEAARICGGSPFAIRHCAAGRTNSSGGYVWRWA